MHYIYSIYTLWTCCDRPIFAQVRNVDSFASALCGETTLRPLGWAAEIEDGCNGYRESDGHGYDDDLVFICCFYGDTMGMFNLSTWNMGRFSNEYEYLMGYIGIQWDRFHQQYYSHNLIDLGIGYTNLLMWEKRWQIVKSG